MNDFERQVIRVLQADLPIESKPFYIMAGKIGADEQAVLVKTHELLQKGVIRKIGAVLQHRRIGYNANALCAWVVPPERVEEVGSVFAQMPAVTHCYERRSYPDWPYNIYTMVHERTRDECERTIASMAQKCRVFQYKTFYSTKEFKKTSMKYFD